MDPVEYVEKIFNIKLLGYQKRLIQELANRPRDELQYMYGRRGFIYVIPKDHNTKLPKTYQRGLRAKTCILDDFMDLEEHQNERNRMDKRERTSS